MNWQDDFAADGSLRDLCVRGATLEDWRRLLPFLAAEYAAPALTVEQLRTATTMRFFVGEVELACHFFTPDEIELDFYPNGVDQARLDGLLRFMKQVGALLDKTVILTPENQPERLIFRYDPLTRNVEWIPPC